MTVTLALILGIGLPSLALGALLTPVPASGEHRPGVLFGRSLTAGVTVWLIVSGLCARAGAVNTAVSWTVDALLGAASLGVLALPRCRRVLAAAWVDLLYGLGLAALSLVVWLPIFVLNLRTSWGVLGSTPWYYWNLAAQVAHAGHVPSRSLEWGTSVPFLDDYHLFTTATASLLTQTSGTGLDAVKALVVLSVVVTGCGAGLLAVAFGAGRGSAACAVPVAVGLEWLAVKLTSYRPEAFATGLGLLAVAVAVDHLRHREWGALAVTAGSFAALAEVHGLVLIGALCMLFAAAVALVPTRRRLWRYVRTVVVLGVTTAASTVVLALIMGSRPGSEHVGKLDNISGLQDPTWRFVRAIRGVGASRPPDNWTIAKGALTTSFDGISGWWLVAILVMATVTLLVRAVREPMARRVLLFAVVFLAAIAIPAWLFATGWSSYVPRRTGSQRLAQSALLIVAPLIAWAVAALPRWRVPWLRVGQQLVLLAVLTGIGYRSSAVLEPSIELQRPTEQTVATLRALHVPKDAIILANGYTEGYFATLTAGQGLLEGRAPYTFPDVLQRANAMLEQAAQFYRDPAGNTAILARYHVSYVVLALHGRAGLGTWNYFVERVALTRFARLPQLQLLTKTDDIAVFRVNP